jgi:molybdopterin-guanine dinucleotide biosynthesis protein A
VTQARAGGFDFLRPSKMTPSQRKTAAFVCAVMAPIMISFFVSYVLPFMKNTLLPALIAGKSKAQEALHSKEAEAMRNKVTGALKDGKAAAEAAVKSKKRWGK